MLNNEFYKKFESIRARYVSDLSSKIQKINQYWSNISNHNTTAEIEPFTVEIHNLVGSAKIFNYPDLSDVAKEIEILTDFLKNNFDNNTIKSDIAKRLSLINQFVVEQNHIL